MTYNEDVRDESFLTVILLQQLKRQKWPQVYLWQKQRQINGKIILIEEDFVLVSLDSCLIGGLPEKENSIKSVKYAVLHSSSLRFDELKFYTIDYNIILRLWVGIT